MKYTVIKLHPTQEQKAWTKYGITIMRAWNNYLEASLSKRKRASQIYKKVMKTAWKTYWKEQGSA